MPTPAHVEKDGAPSSGPAEDEEDHDTNLRSGEGAMTDEESFDDLYRVVDGPELAADETSHQPPSSDDHLEPTQKVIPSSGEHESPEKDRRAPATKKKTLVAPTRPITQNLQVKKLKRRVVESSSDKAEVESMVLDPKEQESNAADQDAPARSKNPTCGEVWRPTY